MARSNKCPIDNAAITKILNDIAAIVDEIAFGSGSEIDLEARVMEKIKEYAKVYSMQKKNVLVKTIFDCVSDIAGDSIFLSSEEKIKEYLNNITKDEKLRDTSHDSSNIIETVKDAASRKEMTSAFLTKAYGTAINIRNLVDRRFTKSLVDSFLVNRESGVVISTTAELNENINRFKERLFSQITKYLNSIRTSLNKIPEDITTRTMFQDQSYTGIMEDPDFKMLIDNYVLKGIVDLSSDVLPILLKENPLKLEAFNAYVILSNFDTYVHLKLGDSIVIQNPGKHEWTKYNFASKNKNIANNFQIGNDIDFEKEVNDIVKLLITTTKIYDWQGTKAKADKFLTFNKFSTFIGRLKNSVFSKNVRDIVFDEDFNEDIWESFSESTRELIKGKSLARVINESKRNTQAYLEAIFEILSNQKFYDTYRSVYGVNGLNMDNTDDLSTLYSIYKGIFDRENKESLLYLKNTNLNKHNYYSDITSIINSIYKITHVQYFQNESGQIKMRTLLDLNLNNISRKLEQAINISHSLKLVSKDSFEGIEEINQGIVTNAVKIRFTIPNTDIVVTATTTGDIRFERNGRPVIFTEDNLNDIIPFIDLHLPLNLTDDLILLSSILEDRDLSLNRIATMAARTVLNQYVLATKLKGLTGKSLDDAIKKIYGDNQRTNRELNEVNMISQDDITTLRALSRQIALLSGQLDSSTVKDAEGNGISQEALNRLFECYQSQVDLFKSDHKYALWPLSIVTDGLISGVASIRELKTNETLKKAIQFNPAEGQYSLVVYDFIYGLIEEGTETTDILKKGVVAFTPSVFSDKPLIGKLLLDLNKTIKGVKLREATVPELVNLFATEISQVYEHAIKNVEDDLSKIFYSDEEFGHIIDALLMVGDPSAKKEIYSDEFFNLFNDYVIKKDKELENAFNEANKALPTKNKYVHIDAITYLNNLVARYNETHADKIALVPEIHYCKGKSSSIVTNKSLIELRDRFADTTRTQTWLKYQNGRMLTSLLNSGFSVDCAAGTLEANFLANKMPREWIDEALDLILGKISIKLPNGTIKLYNLSSSEDLQLIFSDLGIKTMDQLDELIINSGDKNLSTTSETKNIDYILSIAEDFQLNPLLERMNVLDYFVTQEFMLATVGTFAAHKVKGNFATVLQEESLRYYAQHKRNNDLTASTHAFELGKIDGIPEDYNIAVIEDFVDLLYNVAGRRSQTKPFDGSTIVNPFIVLLENNSLGPQRVGVTKKQFIHYYHPSLATGGDIKTAGFGMTNDLIRNSLFMQIAMLKMTSGKWRNQDGSLITDLNILKSYDGKDIMYGEDGIFFARWENGLTKYYKVTNIQYLGLNQYVRTLLEVDLNGEEIGSAFDEQPIVIDNNYSLWKFFGGERAMSFNSKGELEWSEASIDQTVKAIINVGTKLNDEVKTADDVYQPLKHSDIHYLCNEGSIKYGAANMNYVLSMNDPSRLFSYFTIKMYNAGIQLDKEHSADESDLSLMTQVMSACAAMGYTFSRAEKVYEALSQIGQINISDLLTAVENDTDVRTVLNKLIALSIAKSSGTQLSFLDIFAKRIVDKYNNNEEITDEDDTIPVSDNSVISKILSNISVNLTKKGIRLKVPGTLSVISPGYKVMRIYAGKKLEEFDDFETQIAELQAQQKATYSVTDPNTSYADIELGRNYIIRYLDGTTENVFMADPIVYNEYRQKLPLILDITESLREGRELASYNVRFKGTDGKTYSIYDLDSLQDLFNLDKKVYPTTNKLAFYRLALQNDLKALSRNYEGADKSLTVKIGGVDVEVDLSSIKILNYEVIMPKVFASAFLLGKYDSVAKIKSDKYFFTKKLIEKTKANIDESDYDLALKKHSGKHIFLISDITKSKNLKELLANIVTDDEGTFLIDINGNKVILLSNPNDKIYTDGQNIVIKTDNIKYYVDNQSYFTLQISTNVQNDSDILSIIDDSSNKTARKWYRLARKVSENFKNQNYKNVYDFSDITDDFWKDTKAVITRRVEDTKFNDLFDQGQEIYKSWELSLKVIAARIPAQSQQSFMAMDVIGYENADVNNAYVSSMQLWLQGSDLDIDAVSIQTFDISDAGKIELWSPYANVEYQLNDSLELPFPTGKELQLIELPNYPYAEESKKLLLFIQDKVIIFERNHKGELRIRINPNTDVKNIKALLETYKDGIKIPKENSPYRLKFVDIINTIDPSLQLTSDDFSQIIDQLKNVIDKHNLYLIKSNTSKQGQILNNFLIYNEIEIIQDPVNLFEAQTPVDDATKPFKEVGNNSKKGKATLYKSPGNSANKSEGIYETQTGKGCVGICAVGMKTMFAITQYYNKILNNGTEEELQRLLFPLHSDTAGVLKNGHFINGKWYTKFANVKASDPRTIKLGSLAEAIYDIKDIYNVEHTEELSNELVIEILRNATNEEDAAIALSALMSLATDNAKELQLSKLNAGMKTISMYIFGLSIGMSFNDISKIMLSDFVDLCCKLIEGNTFLGDRGLFSMDKVFDYFENGPSTELSKFKLADNFLSIIELPEKYKGAKRLAQFCSDRFKSLDLKLLLLEKYILKDMGDVTPDHYKLLKFVKKYCIQQEKRLRCPYYNDIKTLAGGAEELRILGSMLRLNQGLPNSIPDIIAAVDSIENAINTRIKNRNSEHRRKSEKTQLSTEDKELQNAFRFDLYKFAFDEDYRKEIVQKYDEYKHTINILDVITSVPHYLQYVKTLATLHKSALLYSSKYRSLYALYSSQEIQQLGLSSDSIKGMNDFLGDHMINQFLLGNDFVFEVPSFEYELNGVTYITTEGLKIKLGTKEGNAIFKAWMDKVVFKDLQNNGGPKNNPNIKNNAFIRSIQPTLFTHTFDGNPIVAWGTKESTLPSNDFEQSQFDALKNAFNDLTGYWYGDIPIADLLFLYNLITYGGKLGTQTFTKLFEDKLELPIIKNLHDFINELDKSGSIILLKEDFDLYALLEYIAPRGNIHYSYLKFIRAKNAKGEYKLYRRENPSQRYSEEEEEAMDLIDDEEFGHNTSNYTLIFNIDRKTKSLTYKSKRGYVKLLGFDEDAGVIRQIKIGNKIIDAPMAIYKIDLKSGKTVDFTLVDDIIENELNPCE